eukprot:CAMPEP_0174275656 /NCGR_PEP_ID=MMETSP0439-20130205/59945_1 /TAXON_ID=0 /ORGANISM="Stereomyxa ramosa, Strain Chinc5" /LENGTH=129 /DNA_ID=CAMNT_0015367787 /DNA_START=1575 /DNA_END=1961 /DNA_ORIENTATION=-
MSGINVSEEAEEVFMELKQRGTYRCVFFKIADDYSKVVVDKTLPRCTSYQDFLDQVDDKECRYIAYDYDTGRGNVLLLIHWVPDNSRVKPKQLYNSTLFNIRTSGKFAVRTVVHATDASELDEQAIKDV